MTVITTHRERGNGDVRANPLLMAHHRFSKALMTPFKCDAG